MDYKNLILVISWSFLSRFLLVCLDSIKKFKKIIETMKIYGIGTDIINIQRIKKSLNNKKFIKEFLIKLKYLDNKLQRNKINCFAKRFAAKEAFSKAIGTRNIERNKSLMK